MFSALFAFLSANIAALGAGAGGALMLHGTGALAVGVTGLFRKVKSGVATVRTVADAAIKAAEAAKAAEAPKA